MSADLDWGLDCMPVLCDVQISALTLPFCLYRPTVERQMNIVSVDGLSRVALDNAIGEN